MLGDRSRLVTAIGFGAMGLSLWYGDAYKQADEVRLKFLDEVYARGERNWDTADVYADSEDLIGKWFKRTGKRDDIFLATKFGCGHGEKDRLVRADLGYVREAFEKSIKRLGVDHVDLYYLHRADPTVPIELTVGAMAENVKEGKVKYLGLSEVSAATLRRAHAVHPLTALQVEYSPFDLSLESPQLGLLKTARELGVTIVAYSPLGRGLLTGAIKSPDDLAPDDSRRWLPRFSKENFPNVLKLVDGLNAIAAKHGATSGQVALAWLLAQGDDVIPIPGTTKVKNLEDNLGALSVQLSPEESKEIRDAAEKLEAIQGPRYPPEYVAIAFADTPELK
ncbi:Aldo/keto reductase [Punctularia strigosozonata HHB-11173 SS5]|uniref:Aldo/keto reductase n=1 Tax=Punctularia strigosozonata (strain HHB-11173) TaxID=741275 RepID=UPI000441844F|nr:Aldo/keto reductase [Punctularia strigosozonata HHB-11173 SS5]EIN08892.1 Aldo/keto reductase [Punctularia strigosozonata HHB-11173 SS5]